MVGGSSLAYHMLRITDAVRSIAFYCDTLGMTLLATIAPVTRDTTVYVLGCVATLPPGISPTWLVLVHQRGVISTPLVTYTHHPDDGYWKIGLTLPDVDRAVERLRHRGVAVSQPEQFLDIGYLCHVQDPDGYIIELLQQDFAHNFRRMPTPAGHPDAPLGALPTFGQITLRIKDPAQSLPFYQQLLGMRLLAVMDVTPYHFTLYFLAYTDDTPPVPDDMRAIANREWLWRRPYTTLELQYRWGTATQPSFAYRRDAHTPLGFAGIGIVGPHVAHLYRALQEADITILQDLSPSAVFKAPSFTIADPDGVAIEILEPTSLLDPSRSQNSWA